MVPSNRRTAQAGISTEHPPHSELTLLRRKQVEAETGYARSTIYKRISEGLFVKPVSLGARAVGFPAGEVRAINAARIGGASVDEIRCLVSQLESRRRDWLAHRLDASAG